MQSHQNICYLCFKMEELDNLTLADEADLIATLPVYQQTIVKNLINHNGNDYLGAAEGWISASLTNVSKFGGENRNQTYRKSLLDELRKYLCGDAFYENDRQNLQKIGKKTYPVIIGALTMAISPVVGVAAPLLAPAIILILLSIGKMSVNAWCNLNTQV